jgi:DNA-binding NarL/FixJ family response regulator
LFKSIRPRFPAVRAGAISYLLLIAAGKSNAEIAEALVIGESTVITPVSSIPRKLHLEDRTQAAVFARQAGIVGRN